MRLDEVRCRDCGQCQFVTSGIGIAPTPEIVAAVCEREPCPECGGAMEPAAEREASTR